MHYSTDFLLKRIFYVLVNNIFFLFVYLFIHLLSLEFKILICDKRLITNVDIKTVIWHYFIKGRLSVLKK